MCANYFRRGVCKALRSVRIRKAALEAFSVELRQKKQLRRSFSVSFKNAHKVATIALAL